MTIDVQEHFDSVEVFNFVAGNLDKVDKKSIEAQLSFISEELDETWKATEDNDNVELLDGACDLFVTVAGLLTKLEIAGFDVDRALYRVCQNNLSKFPKLEGAYKLCPDGASITNKGSRAVFKRISDGKIMKPTNFVPVTLADLAPQQFEEVNV
jgi:phosphoribosyl-ATP pyrophosphohydrolase